MSTDAEAIAREAAPIGHGKLQWRILIGFVLGLAAGLLTYTLAPDAPWVETVTPFTEPRSRRTCSRRRPRASGSATVIW